MGVDVDFKWNMPVKQIAKESTGGDKTQLFIANTTRRLMNEFVPYDHGPLSDTVDVYIENGVGIVHYKQPYAEYQYEGTHLHHPADGKHPKATSFWDKAMMNCHSDKLINDTQAFINKGG